MVKKEKQNTGTNLGPQKFPGVAPWVAFLATQDALCLEFKHHVGTREEFWFQGKSFQQGLLDLTCPLAISGVTGLTGCKLSIDCWTV